MNESDTQELDPKAAMQALERFVVENDDLLELEERIGRFNIFDALGIARKEIRHSNFLAWLLDPAESHGQGALFLRAVLMDLMKEVPAELRAINPVELDGAELRGVEVRREWRHIDLLIVCKEPEFVVAIENKVDSGEHSNQLQRYEDVVNTAFPSSPKCFVFLTPDGQEASDEDWAAYTYGDIHRVLARVRKTNEQSIGDDVLAFLDHYLRLIGSRFMDDPKIDELCQRIYKNHKPALDLIFDRVGPGSEILDVVEQVVREHEAKWFIVSRTSRHIAFLPEGWLKILPKIGARKKFDARAWLVLSIVVRPHGCFLARRVWPTTDLELRRKVIDRLIENKSEFGFRQFMKNKEAGQKFATLGREHIMKWSEDESPDLSILGDAVQKTLSKLVVQLEGLPAAVEKVLMQNATKR